MRLPKFKLEEYFAQWEFKATHLLCSSDVEKIHMNTLLNLADEECLNLWNHLHLGYTETRGLPILREQIGKQYDTIQAKNVLCFSGAEEGIFCTMEALLEPEDHVIVITPCYQSLESLPSSRCKVSSLELDSQQGWALDFDELEKIAQVNTKMLVINYPHNPTGALLSKRDFDQVVAFARKRGLILFSDEAYRLLEVDEEDRLPAAADLYENAISLSVVSKTLGLGGLRIGWIASKNQTLLDSIAEFKHYTTICNSGPSEILGLIALRNTELLINQNREMIKTNLELLDGFFEKYSQIFSWVRPKGGVIGFVKLLSEKDADGFCAKLVEQTGVLLLPGRVFDCDEGYFRIGFGRKNMPEALAKFESFLQTI